MNIRTKSKKNSGFSLVEALVALAVASVGMLGVAQVQSTIAHQSSSSKSRSEAAGLVQEKVEKLRNFTTKDFDTALANTADPDPSESIDGVNAQFTRSWNITTDGEVKNMTVSVSWTDSRNQLQQVDLSSAITFEDPRSVANSPADPLLDSATGRASLGEGNVADRGITIGTTAEWDGDGGTNSIPDGTMVKFSDDGDLLLVDPDDGAIVLTMKQACVSGTCTDFVTISGTIYIDTASNHNNPSDVYIKASDAAYCLLWVDPPEGSSGDDYDISSDVVPETATGDYKYFEYTCYLGGGWHGNIGFVLAGGIQQSDKICQGDPTSDESSEEPVIAIRRSYRGMLWLRDTVDPTKVATNASGDGIYYSHGIKDATIMSGHDYVYASLSTGVTEGINCIANQTNGQDGPMMQTDSNSGTLFAGNPTDFVCLNADDDTDGSPDYLDDYTVATYGADTSCPYDPTDPPTFEHQIQGTLSLSSSVAPDLDTWSVNTSDGEGNCTFDSADFTSAGSDHTVDYTCNVYQWTSAWVGYVDMTAPENYICLISRHTYADGDADYAAIAADRSTANENYTCFRGHKATVSGIVTGNLTQGNVFQLESAALSNGGSCTVGETGYGDSGADAGYSCTAVFNDGDSWNGDLSFTAHATGQRKICTVTSPPIEVTSTTIQTETYNASGAEQHDIVLINTNSSCN
jgi:Tfp pilus assembly protein PilV